MNNMKETKRCPYCGEEILAVAKKCRHCGEWLYPKEEGTKDESQRGTRTTGNSTHEQRKKEEHDSSLMNIRFVIWAIGIALVMGICIFVYTLQTTEKEKEAAARPEDPVINFDDDDSELKQGPIGKIFNKDYDPQQELTEKRPTDNSKANDTQTETDNIEALLALGERFEKGTDTEVNYETAFFYYYKAAEAGDPTALNKVGNMYAQGKGCVKDPYKAAKCYLAAAERGNKHAQHNIAFCYWDGVGVKKDHELAVIWMRRSASQGYQKAQQALTIMVTP